MKHHEVVDQQAQRLALYAEAMAFVRAVKAAGSRVPVGLASEAMTLLSRMEAVEAIGQPAAPPQARRAARRQMMELEEG
jgi:hypothetical protein